MVKPIFLEWLDISSKDVLLDVGCDNGGNVHYLNKNKLCTAVGIDINKKSFSKNRYNVLICGDARNLPFKNKSFTKVICTEVLEHNKDDDIVLECIRNVLKPNGTLFLTTPRHIKFLDFYDPAWLSWKLMDRRRVHRHYTLDELNKKLKKHGFTIKRCDVMLSYSWLILRWLNTVFKNIFKVGSVFKHSKITRGNFDIFILAKLENKHNEENNGFGYRTRRKSLQT